MLDTGIPKQDSTLDMEMLPNEGMEEPTEDIPPMNDIGGEIQDTDMPSEGDGMQDIQTNNDEGIDIYNSLPVEKKSAAIKYMKSMQDDSSSDSNDDKNKQQANMPMESKRSIEDLVTEITNGIINDFDMNDREGVKGTKRDERKITNKDVKRRIKMNPFVSRR